MTHAERMAAIRAREVAATPGEWWIPTKENDGRALSNGVSILCRHDDSEFGSRKRVLCSMNHWFEAEHNYNSPDKQFIAHARADIPYLLKRIAALEAALGEAIEDIQSDWHGDIARLTAIKEGTTDAD